MVRKLLKKIFKIKDEEDVQDELFPKPVYIVVEEPVIDES
jgi:hypothetical protein